MSIELKSNEFWGRRSGTPKHRGKSAGAFITPSFPQMQFGSGSSGAGKAFHNPFKNVPRKWFGKNYKSKRGTIEVLKGKKK
jgi:hypothetical protein